MIRLLLATGNRHKLGEMRGLLAGAPVEVLSLADVPPVPEPEETGATFEENARLKAHYYDAHKGPARMWTVAEDSGLVVDALDGEPGVFSARFLRPDATYPERFAEIYRRLAARPERPRTARFVCAVAIVDAGRLIYEITRTVEGEIAAAPSGNAGFGYDPIFHYPPFGSTLADVTEADKLRVAHRGKAFRELAAWLREAVQTKNGEF